jgi:hypothetical protein
MSLGKDSIQKRVAKPATEAPKAPAKKAPAKKTAPKSAVMTNVAPETVEKVIAHKENDNVVKYSLGEKLPYYLL